MGKISEEFYEKIDSFMNNEVGKLCELEGSLLKIIKNMDDLIEAKNQEISKLKKMVSGYIAERTSLKEELSENKELLEAVNSENYVLRNKEEGLYQTIEELHDENIKLHREIEEYKNNEVAYDDTIDDLKEAIGIERERVANLGEKLCESKEQISQLEETVKWQSDYIENDTYKKNAEEEIVRLKDQLNQAKVLAIHNYNQWKKLAEQHERIELDRLDENYRKFCEDYAKWELEEYFGKKEENKVEDTYASASINDPEEKLDKIPEYAKIGKSEKELSRNKLTIEEAKDLYNDNPVITGFLELLESMGIKTVDTVNAFELLND